MILEGFVDSEERRLEMLKIAYEHNDNQLNIINDLLSVAQIESKILDADYKQTDIVTLLEKIVLSQKPDFDKRRISLNLTYENKPVNLEVDPLHMQMVFDNLIDNANKYSAPGGAVEIRVSDNKDTVAVEIQDEGVGIAAKDIPKLFNKFSRVDKSSSVNGTGLGLYWAKKLVELYGGDITIHSKPRKGTTFCVTIPKDKRA
jgi:two-component system phosphate regulon sensor histidine kinase PhoR